MKTILAIAALILGTMLSPGFVFAQSIGTSNTSFFTSPVASAVHITGPDVAYGDIVVHDVVKDVYLLSQYPDDPRIYGVAAQNPPLVLFADPSDVPVVRQGPVLVNVTLENGPIQSGDGISASSLSGKGMRAAATSEHIIGIAREAFTGTGSSTAVDLNGKSIPAGTIIVDVGNGVGGALGSTDIMASKDAIACKANPIVCNVLAKINAAPLMTLMRYIMATTVALGSLYLAFRSFMTDAVNGVLSVGRNPRAKTAIQAMVIFNAVLAGGIAAVGLAAGLAILFVPI